jgi:TolA-binding protein
VAGGIFFMQSGTRTREAAAAESQPAATASIAPVATTPTPTATPAASTSAPVVEAPKKTATATSPAGTTPAASAATDAKRAAAAATTAPGTTSTAVDATTGRPARTADPIVEQMKVARAKFDAKLYDQGIADLKTAIAQSPSSASAPAAQLLLASAYERQGHIADAMAAYVELRSKYTPSPEAAEGTVSMADLVLRSKQDDRENSARTLYSDVISAYPTSIWAPRALSRRAALEERMKLRIVDPELGSVPASVISYRMLVRDYPTADGVEQALDKLASAYEDLRRYELAAAALEDLATKFPQNTRDAAWRAAELYAKLLKNPDRARAAYSLVPSTSSRYRDAQKKLAQ